MNDRLDERFVTVGEFTKTYEAYLARDRLEAEGIRSYIEGETGHELFTFAGISVVRLRVREDEAARAVGVLASCCEEERDAGDSLEDEAEEGVWLCSVCGDAVPLDGETCPSCATSRSAIQAEAPRARRWHWRRGADEDAIRKKEENTTADVPPPPAPESLPQVEEGDFKLPGAETSKADELAGHALVWGIAGSCLLALVLVNLHLGLLLAGLCELYTLFLLWEVFSRCRELSARGAMALSMALLFVTPAVVFLINLLGALWQ